MKNSEFIVNKDLLEGFNDAQREAVLYNDGPSLVIAGAGSGKTRVLTHKIAYLLEEGYEPWSILALTFTNKAAREMKERIAVIVGEENARYLWMGTFHSVFLRILRMEHEALGFSSNFTIYDSSDSKNLVKGIIKDMGLDDKVYKPSSILGKISMLKNQLVSPEDYACNNACFQEDLRSKIPMLRDIYRTYVARCKQSDVMDFDDILVYTFRLFEANEDVRRKYVERFKYVLVDEYQDTNLAQHRIVWQLTKERQRICVVGDDSQSIYSFRGANIDNILTFKEIYSDCKLFKLERNYRSTQMIVGAANSLIKKNFNQIHKNVFSENERGEKLSLIETYSDIEEATVVAKKLSYIKLKEGCRYSDFAILYRTNAQSRIFEETFRKNAIPYRIYGGLSFYQRKEIKDIIAYFRLSVNPNDEEAFKRVINYPARGIGNTTIGKIVSAANYAGVSLWNVICSPLEYGLDLNKGTYAKVDSFRTLIDDFRKMAQTENADVVGRDIIKRSGIVADVYADTSPEGKSRQENIEELLSGLESFCTSRMEEGNTNVSISDYLSEVSLLSDLDSDDGESDDKVSLMTIHSAKGLEFNTVFVVGLEENLFPSQMASSSPREMEEERRLFYVAITRASLHCFLTFAKSRFRYGKMEFATKSRFVDDIAPEYVDKNLAASWNSKQSNVGYKSKTEYSWKNNGDLFGGHNPAWQRKSEPITTRISAPQNYVSVRKVATGGSKSSQSLDSLSANRPIAVGCSIEHERFGIGVVEKIEGVGENCKATVSFKHVGTKQLLLKFAKFKVL